MDKGTVVFACKEGIRGFGEVLLVGEHDTFVELGVQHGGWAVRGEVIPCDTEHHPLVGFPNACVIPKADLAEEPLLTHFTHCPVHGSGDCPNL